MDEHFNPPYNPWEQRLCAVPGGDLFKVISAQQASMVTDHIEQFTSTGITLRSGKTARRRYHCHRDRPEFSTAGRVAAPH